MSEFDKIDMRAIDAAEQMLDSGMLSEALHLMHRAVLGSKIGELQADLDSVKAVYTTMLRYMLSGVHDAERDRIEGQLYATAYSVCDRLRTEIGADMVQGYEYSHMSDQRQDVSYEVRRLQQICDKRSLDALISDVFAHGGESAVADKELDVSALFDALFYTTSLTPTDKVALEEFVVDARVAVVLKCPIVAALTLSALTHFDEAKVHLLIALARSAEEALSIRAEVALLLIMMRFKGRLHRYAVLESELRSLFVDAAARRSMTDSLCCLLRTMDVEAINRQINDDLMPEIMNLSPKINERFRQSGGDEVDEERMMDEMQDMLEESGLGEKLNRLSELMRDGVDVYYTSFSTLKGYDFFRTASNWFLPFYASNKVAAGLGDGSKEMLSLLERSLAMCDGDKYSFCLSLMQVPEDQRRMLKQNIERETQQHASDVEDKALGDAHLHRMMRANGYVQCLYRFYRLFREKMYYNPLTKLEEWCECSLLIESLGDEMLAEVSEFCFAQKHYDMLLALCDRMSDAAQHEVDTVKRRAFAYQRTGRYSEALRWYECVCDSGAENRWVRIQMARCYKALQCYDDALLCYRTLLQQQTDDVRLQLSEAGCLYAMGRYEEALSVYYKVNYFNPDNAKALSQIAWCALLCGKAEQAERYFAKLPLEQRSVRDVARQVLACLVSRDPKAAKRYYAQVSDTEQFFECFGEAQRQYVAQNGAPEGVEYWCEYLRLL